MRFDLVTVSTGSGANLRTGFGSSTSARSLDDVLDVSMGSILNLRGGGVAAIVSDFVFGRLRMRSLIWLALVLCATDCPTTSPSVNQSAEGLTPKMCCYSLRVRMRCGEDGRLRGSSKYIRATLFAYRVYVNKVFGLIYSQVECHVRRRRWGSASRM